MEHKLECWDQLPNIREGHACVLPYLHATTLAAQDRAGDDDDDDETDDDDDDDDENTTSLLFSEIWENGHRHLPKRLSHISKILEMSVEVFCCRSDASW